MENEKFKRVYEATYEIIDIESEVYKNMLSSFLDEEFVQFFKRYKEWMLENNNKKYLSENNYSQAITKAALFILLKDFFTTDIIAELAKLMYS